VTRFNEPFNLERELAVLSAFHAAYKHCAVGVIYGPRSREDKYYIERAPDNQISFVTLVDSLRRLHFNVVHVDPTRPNFLDLILFCDLLFLNMHGEYGEDGRLQGFLDYLGKPYTGSGVLASSIGLNKIMFKHVMAALNVTSPTLIGIPDIEDLPILDVNSFPVVAKPISGGSSIGMRLLKNFEEFLSFFAEKAQDVYGPYFLESFISGRSLTVGVLELEHSLIATPIIEIIFDGEYYNEHIKLDEKNQSLVKYVIPAPLDAVAESEIKRTALTVHQALGCVGFSRVDFLLSDDDGRPYVLEINTIPGISKGSNFFAGTAALGFSYDEMVLAMLRSCLWTKT